MSATPAAAVRIVPANEATWADIQAVFGTRGEPARCQCQRYKVPERELRPMTVEERAFRLREQTDCDNPGSGTTSGLLAYVGDEPVAWCAVEPRTEYPRMVTMPIPWKGRDEDRDDAGVWAITCFVTRVGHRRQGLTRPLVLAAVEHARAHGAHAIEAYPMVTEEGVDITWGELHVGPLHSLLAAGFREVTHPTKRRYVVRLELSPRTQVPR